MGWGGVEWVTVIDCIFKKKIKENESSTFSYRIQSFRMDGSGIFLKF